MQVIRIEQTHLATAEEQRSVVQARIDLEKAGRQAQLLLLRQQYLSPRDLQDHLLKRLAAEFTRHGMSRVAGDEDRLEAALALILVRFPGLLKEVEKTCLARFSFTRETEPLPGCVESAEPLAPSFKNIYGIFPADLNKWEREFAKLLDSDTSGTVLWWHRKPTPTKSTPCCAPRQCRAIERRGGQVRQSLNLRMVFRGEKTRCLPSEIASGPDGANMRAASI